MIVNGKKYEYDEILISELLEELSLKKDKIVIEVNGDIIKKTLYSDYMLKKSDSIEIIAFVGGG